MTTFMTLAAAIPALLMPAANIPPATVPTLDVTAAASAPAPARAEQRRYCVVDQITGSRLARKQCQTRADWARDGVDVDKLTK